MKDNIILTKSFDFAIKTINTYKILVERKEFVMSKQVLRSGTSVGANVREGINACSRADFIYKLTISQKECAETIYWIELLKETNYISIEEFTELNSSANEILKILKSIIISSRASMN